MFVHARDYQDAVGFCQQHPVRLVNQNSDMPLSERLKKARTDAGMSQQELADKAGCGQPIIGNLESGEQQSSRYLTKIAYVLGVSPLWLETGIGPMRSSIEAVEPGTDFVPIARVLLKLEAGVTGYHVQQIDGDGEPIYFRRDFLQSRGWKPERLFALKVTGDSMEPSLFDGDLVVVNSADTTPADGEVFAVNYEGQPVIKRLRRDAGVWWLDSDNPRYKPKRCDEHAILIGRVVYRQTEHI